MTSLGTVSRVRIQSVITFQRNMLNFTPFSTDQSTGLLTITLYQCSERMSDARIDSCSTVASFGSSPVMGLFTA